MLGTTVSPAKRTDRDAVWGVESTYRAQETVHFLRGGARISRKWALLRGHIILGMYGITRGRYSEPYSLWGSSDTVSGYQYSSNLRVFSGSGGDRNRARDSKASAAPAAAATAAPALRILGVARSLSLRLPAVRRDSPRGSTDSATPLS